MEESKKIIQVKVDKEVADEARQVLNGLGLTTTSAVNLLLKRIVATGSLPINLELTAGERATLDFKENTKNVPRHVFKNKKDVEEWIEEDEH